jgi:hypothetical protein
MHHKLPMADGYHIDDKAGLAMLVPDAARNTPSDFQATTFTLPAASSPSGIRAQDTCAIQGAMFSISPGSGSDRSSWTVRSPSSAGWDTVSGQTDADVQWQLFVRELARMHDHGCFAPGISTQFIRSSIAERIPLPASLVPTFMYSDQGERFVDLAPGMQVRIQKVLPAGTAANAGAPVRMMTVDYDVVARPGGGIGLRRSRSPGGVKGMPLTTNDRQLLILGQQLASTAVLRLFLEGFSVEKQGRLESTPLLMGASDTTQLDSVNDLMRQQESITCVQQPSLVCVNLPPNGVSLSSIIWINGRQTLSAFGTSLESLLSRLPDAKQADVLASVRVLRKLSSGRYASIEITRTIEGATQLLLLPGDRVEWKD